MDVETGSFLVKIAREAITEYLRTGGRFKPQNRAGLEEKLGVFVTLETYPKKELRGCIGYPEPTHKLSEALVDSAISAATRDPRFPPVDDGELEHIVIEVTVLSPPQLIRANSHADYLRSIKVGRDGLIVENGVCRGLLLPQVPVEYSWTVKDFIEHTCLKAGLDEHAWQEPSTKVYSFSGELFCEQSPKGSVVKKEFK